MTRQLRTVEGEVGFINLVADISFPLQTSVVSLKAGQGILLAGSVIGKNAAGDYVLVDSSPEITPHSVLIENIDTNADTSVGAQVYLSGVLNRNALILGGETAIDSIEDGLRTRGIYLKEVI